MKSNGINSRGLSKIAEGLKQNNALKVVHLWGNRFDSEACESFIPLLDGVSVNVKVGSQDDRISEELIKKLRSSESREPITSVNTSLVHNKGDGNPRLPQRNVDFQVYRVESKPFAAEVV